MTGLVGLEKADEERTFEDGARFGQGGESRGGELHLGGIVVTFLPERREIPRAGWGRRAFLVIGPAWGGVEEAGASKDEPHHAAEGPVCGEEQDVRRGHERR